ncbi:uncharacterized protein LOC127881606 isoform X4 [Dreissena polymorpha]|nr:uncharacterized protein LOC127881606 isoform X4 [Dreissena polymorpha]
MGSGISTLCTGKRSVFIANSVRKLPTIREDDVDSDFDVEHDLEINPTAGKLHPAESRDSGIGENDVPNGYFIQRHNSSGFLKTSPDSSPETNNNDNDTDEEHHVRVSRPHSCRLGHRGHRGQSANSKNVHRAELSESQIRNLVRSARNQTSRGAHIIENTAFDLSDDNLSINSASSMSPDRRQTQGRPKSSRRRSKGRKKRTSGAVDDIDSSTDTDGVSDTDMLSIPDETAPFSSRGEGAVVTPQRRGWVRNDDFTDVMITTSVTPRVGTSTDTYRVVSGTFSDVDVNLAKKASERSISSIILTPLEGTCTPTNSECFDVSGSPTELCYNHCEGNLEDLVSSLVSAIERLWSRDLVTSSDFEHVMKGLRYQLVAMAMGHMCRQATPRIEVKGEQTNIFTDETWRVQIRLRAEDEEIIETSERTLALHLCNKGRQLTREDISILLAEHLKSIENLQQVQDAFRHQDQTESLYSSCKTARESASETRKLLNRRPQSASKLRKLNSDSTATSDTLTIPLRTNINNNRVELPPIAPNDKSKGPYSKTLTSKRKIKAVSVTRKSNSTNENCEALRVVSPEVDSVINNHDENLPNELTEIESEDIALFEELKEAFRLLWPALTLVTVQALVAEYRRREAILILRVVEHAHSRSKLDETATRETKAASDTSLHTGNTTGSASTMGQQHSIDDNSHCHEKTLRKLDEEFLKGFDKDKADVTVDAFVEALTDHMKKTRLIRVQSLNLREDGTDWDGDQRSNSCTGFSVNNAANHTLKRQHSFCGAVAKNNTFGAHGGSRQNSFVQSLPASRQNSYCRTRSRGSTGSSYTYSTTSSGVSSAVHSDGHDSNGSKRAISRELSYGLLTDFEDIDEREEEAKTARENLTARVSAADKVRPPSGRRSNGSRAASGQSYERERRRGQTQTHGLGLAAVETVQTPGLRKIEEDAMPKVEELGSKMTVRSRPDSGIAVSMSSASYSSSEHNKERDLNEPSITTSCQEMVETVSKVLPDHHNDLKSLVAAITKGLNSTNAKAQALYCWLTSQKPVSFENATHKSSSPSGKFKQLHEKKLAYQSMYMDMLKIAGLKCEKVEGYVKSTDYLPGNTVQSPKFQHTWVAIAMDGHYLLADPQYGAQGDRFSQQHYFGTSPDELILSHFPKDKK